MKTNAKIKDEKKCYKKMLQNKSNAEIKKIILQKRKKEITKMKNEK